MSRGAQTSQVRSWRLTMMTLRATVTLAGTSRRRTAGESMVVRERVSVVGIWIGILVFRIYKILLIFFKKLDLLI